MKLRAVVNNREYALAIDRDGDNATVQVDGRTYDLHVSEIDKSGYLILDGTRVNECLVLGKESTFDVFIRGRKHRVEIFDPKRLRGLQTSGSQEHELAQIIAPMPGKVVRLLVSPGAVVDAGAGLVVVEAMKMQNEMKSPRSGTVMSLNVKEGDTVNGGDILAVVE
ncbi:MAG: acetyl-CoA carboxylase biotin carboxyl carrier protein subunit [Pyrinomonadaceae bacterium]